MRLDRWRDVHHGAGRFATVTLDCTRQDPEAPDEIRLRWRAARDSLCRERVPAALLDEMEERLTTRSGPGGTVGRVLVGDFSDGRKPELVIDEWLPQPPDEDTTCCGPAPDLRALARSVQRHPPHLVVSMDREGADVTVHPRLGAPSTSERVDGGHEVVHKVRSGDTSHQRMHRRAEDSWQHNAATVAERLSHLCDRHRPAAVLLSGDKHACALLRDQASTRLAELLMPLHSGRVGTLGSGMVDAAVRAGLDQVVADEVERALADFVEVEGRQERAAQGRGPVAAALQRGQVGRILLADPSPSAGTVTVGQDGLPTAEDDVVGGQAVAGATALLAGAMATEADVTLVPEETGLVEGVAAVLRWADPSAPQDSARSMPGHGEGGGW